MSVEVQKTGVFSGGKEIEKFILKSQDTTAVILSYGAVIQSLIYKGVDTVLGYDTVEGYINNSTYQGSVVGRYVGRIKHGKFTHNGVEYQLALNANGKHHTHGGFIGFNRKVWDAKVLGEVLELTYVSPDGEDGYPGTMTAKVRFTVDNTNCLHIVYDATSDADTICNLTNHAYFNLHGGTKPMLSHQLWINAEQYTATDEELIPTGDVPVEGTAYDFRTPRAVGEAIYDNNFVLQNTACGPQATVYEKESGIYMVMFTDLPDVQVYSSTMLTDRQGKNGGRYGLGYGLCLETQLPPNCPNREETGRWLLKAGERWTSETVYQFSVK